MATPLPDYWSTCKKPGLRGCDFELNNKDTLLKPEEGDCALLKRHRLPPPEARISTQSIARIGNKRFSHANAIAGTVIG